MHEAPAAEKLNLLGLSHEGLAAFFEGLGERPFRAVQLIQWIHRQGVGDFQAMTNLAKGLRAQLAEIAQVRLPVVAGHQRSRDGTRKWLVEVDARGDEGKNAVEMVFIPEEGRGTLCISSQAGCPLRCTFCATGRQGFRRNLTSAEIIGQLWLAERLLAGGEMDAWSSGAIPLAPAPREITNVVLMGMGEPLLNLESVIAAVQLMLEDNAYGIGRRRVTVSTTGVVPAMDALAERCPVSLAVSLHAANDALRSELVPLNRKYPLAALLAACRRYVSRAPKDKITFEYVLLRGVNDSPNDARALAHLLSDMPAKVNLIPFNPFPGAPYQRPLPETVENFRDILLARGLMTITRKTRGEDIAAACGQLAGAITPHREWNITSAIPTGAT